MLELQWLGNILIVLGLWYQGTKQWWAFGFSIVGEACWIAYSLSIHIWALTVICCIFAGLAARNLYLWRRQQLAYA